MLSALCLALYMYYFIALGDFEVIIIHVQLRKLRLKEVTQFAQTYTINKRAGIQTQVICVCRPHLFVNRPIYLFNFLFWKYFQSMENVQE